MQWLDSIYDLIYALGEIDGAATASFYDVLFRYFKKSSRYALPGTSASRKRNNIFFRLRCHTEHYIAGMVTTQTHRKECPFRIPPAFGGQVDRQTGAGNGKTIFALQNNAQLRPKAVLPKI